MVKYTKVLYVMPILRSNEPKMYEVGGKKYPSVTTVLKVLRNNEWASAFVLKNGRRELDRLRDDAAALGTRIHAVAERVARDRDHRPTGEMRPYADAVREFLNRHVRCVIATELSLASATERVGGTMDLVCELMDGSVAVVDFKSKRSGGVTDVHRCQLAGYALLLREHGYGVQKRIVVRLHTSEERRGKWYAKSATDHAGDVRAFRAAVELYWWRHGGMLRKRAA